MAQPEKVWCPLCDLEVEAFDLATHKWDDHPEEALRDEQERNEQKRPFTRTKLDRSERDEPIEQSEGVLAVHGELTVQSNGTQGKEQGA